MTTSWEERNVSSVRSAEYIYFPHHHIFYHPVGKEEERALVDRCFKYYKVASVRSALKALIQDGMMATVLVVEVFTTDIHSLLLLCRFSRKGYFVGFENKGLSFR